MPRVWLRRAWRVTWQVLAITALTAVLTEIAFRLVHQVNPLFIFPDPIYNHFRRKPGRDVYGSPVNSRGFRGPEFEVRKQEGVYRILAVGDSFVYGVVPYEHHFLALLERDLRRNHHPVEIINMGIPSIGPGLYHALIVNEGLALDPDLILLFFFVGNDLHVAKPQEETHRSYLLAFLKYLVHMAPAYEGRAPARRDYDDTAPAMKKERHHELLVEKMRSWFRRNNRMLHRGVEGATVYLQRIQRDCDRRDVRLLVVMIPDEIQVDLKLRRSVYEVYPGLRRARMDFGLPNRRLKKKLRPLGIEYYDLLPIFRDVAKTERVYKVRETHWNIRGNQLAAQALYEMLSAQDWLPREEGAAIAANQPTAAP